MSRRYGIVEIHRGHSQYLAHLCKMGAPEDNEVSVCVSKPVYQNVRTDVEEERYEWHIKSESESFRSFFDAIERASHRLDFLMVLTPRGEFEFSTEFLRFSPQCPSLCWHFDGNELVQASRVPATLLQLVRRAPLPIHRVVPDGSLLARGVNQYLLRLFVLATTIREYDGLAVEYPPIKTFVEQRSDIATPVHTLAPTLCGGEEGREPTKRDGPTKVVVPGRVATSVRDYETTLGACERVFQRYNDELSVTILGPPRGDDGRRILERARKLATSGYNITIEDGSTVDGTDEEELIPIETFQRILAESDVFLNPVHIKERRPFGIPDEIRSTSKGTGIIFDSIHHATPLILPDDFYLDKMLASHTETYGSEDELVDVLCGIATEPDRLRHLKREAVANASEYTLKKQQKRFADIVEAVTGEAEAQSHRE